MSHEHPRCCWRAHGLAEARGLIVQRSPGHYAATRAGDAWLSSHPVALEFGDDVIGRAATLVMNCHDDHHDTGCYQVVGVVGFATIS